MTRPPRPTKRRSDAVARLFVAAYPSRGFLDAARTLVPTLALPDHRIVPRDQIHLTVQFIGQREDRELRSIVTSIERSASGLGPIDLIPLRLIGLPPQKSRVAAIETEGAPALLELHRRLAHRLARPIRRDAADRFIPHITLARLRTPETIDPVGIDLPACTVREIALVRSVLKPDGAEHTVAATVPLG